MCLSDVQDSDTLSHMSCFEHRAGELLNRYTVKAESGVRIPLSANAHVQSFYRSSTEPFIRSVRQAGLAFIDSLIG